MPFLLVKGLWLIKPTLDALMKSAHAVSLTERCCVIRNLMTLHEGEKGHADTGNSGRVGGGISAVRAALSKDFLTGKIAVEHLSLESLEDGEGTDPLGAEWLLAGSGQQPGCTYQDDHTH